MGRRGTKKSGRGRGAFGNNGPRRPDERVDKALVVRRNEKFEKYYNHLGIVPNDDNDDFWEAMRRDLPNSFRFTGSKGHALAVQERLRDYYIPEITSITYEGQYVDAPQPVQWYPDQLAWFMTTPKNVIRRFKPFASFQKFLVAETDVGNITRQEVVSMIPPLVMDIKPGMTVLDLCAAPGSKSAQLLEMIHAGEEERSQEVASRFEQGLSRPEGMEFEDDGRSTGLLIANDVDYKRAHMLVHQMKRLSSPNIIVTNHDATLYPSIKIPSESTNGKPTPNKYLKFDRILADVPCSGDGTARKNIEIWKNWNPGNGLGLHATQIRILVRALQMLKVGGRVVYSTCSMNPVEDEAVLAAAIERCGGLDIVELLETKDLLPGLKRYPGLHEWSIMDKTGRIWETYDEILNYKTDHGDASLDRLSESMFPPKTAIPLDRAMRVYPHMQDTGAFFIAVLEKKSEIKVKNEEKQGGAQSNVKVEVSDSNGMIQTLETAPTGVVDKVEADDSGVKIENRVQDQNSEDTAAPGSPKRKRSIDDTPTQDVKRVKTEVLASPAVNGSEPRQAQLKKNRNQPFEEPFKYLDAGIPELERIQKFYNISSRFPLDRFMVRNAEGTASKNIYYTTELAKGILQENEGKGMKFVHCGVKMFVRQDAPSPEVCPWRIQTDGLRILETWVGKERVIKLTKRETMRKLLIEMFPRFHGEEWKNLGEVGEQILGMNMGCCVLVVEPSEAEDGFKERMIFPLWKSVQSVNLMLPKEDRKALLLRLFNDETPLVNLSQGWQKNKGKEEKPVVKVEEKRDTNNDQVVLRNSSSPEPQEENAKVRDDMSEDSDHGGVAIDGGIE